MSVLAMLLILVIILLWLNVKSGLHRSRGKLINCDGIDLNIRWHLISRWPP